MNWWKGDGKSKLLNSQLALGSTMVLLALVLVGGYSGGRRYVQTTKPVKISESGRILGLATAFYDATGEFDPNNYLASIDSRTNRSYSDLLRFGEVDGMEKTIPRLVFHGSPLLPVSREDG